MKYWIVYPKSAASTLGSLHHAMLSHKTLVYVNKNKQKTHNVTQVINESQIKR